MSAPGRARPLVEARGLSKRYPGRGVFGGGPGVTAVDDVSFAIAPGETFALVGESGCGKSTIARLLLKLVEPTAGDVFFDGESLASASPEALRRRRRDMQIVFQDPFGALNPRMSVGEIVAEPLVIHGVGDRASRSARVAELLDLVGLAPAHARRHPHEFSGGQRQRVGIARALALEPRFVVCDEPVSALDVSVQAQILNLMLALQRRLGLTYLFISHNLGVVRQIADRVAVMYLGKIVEIASVDALFAGPRHPYSLALLASVPHPDPDRPASRTPLKGDLPSPFDPPTGCRFHTRCPLAEARCGREAPILRDVVPGHHVACHLA